ncbi:hypothetical protein CMI47_13260 [Candidatus Pacearchaeota archaeon]|nr:hypothetical protein [Candidatus Pacearchaeota archaeon]|tara:strand:- start:684 stop:1394 length:711 start_codon:yes stop_codon:yes gene_type:complete
MSKKDPFADLQNKLDNQDKEKALRTSITVIIDKSGSMRATRDDVIGGFNTFVEEQKIVPGEATLSLVTFSGKHMTVLEDVLLSDVQELTEDSYVPGGGTALLDAMGDTISSLRTRIKNLPKEKRPDKVVIVIMTDGAENSSKVWVKDKVFELVSKATSDGWEFLYIGANQDAISAGQSIGIARNASINYTATSIGTQDIYKSMSRAVTSARAGKTIATTDWKAATTSKTNDGPVNK